MIPRHTMMGAAAATTALVCSTGFAAANCRLALVLAVDVSNSVDASVDKRQRDGLANALLPPQVQQAIFASDLDVALAAFEWSGRHHQEILFDWIVIDNPTAFITASNAVRTSVRAQVDFPTALGHAVDFAADMLDSAPNCQTRTIDVAGEGKNNDGYEPSHAYLSTRFDDITVNGLVVRLLDLGIDFGGAPYYQSQVIHGLGAFIEIAQGFDDYERAMRRKLERELSLQFISHHKLPMADQKDAG